MGTEVYSCMGSVYKNMTEKFSFKGTKILTYTTHPMQNVG